MSHKLTTVEFIEKATQLYGELYDYSKVVYKDSHTKVCIVCRQHGDFLQTPNDHLGGHQCSICVGKTHNQTVFIEKAQAKHSNTYDYTKTVYVRSNVKLIIICKLHGEFEQMPNEHLRGHGCSKCNISHKEREIANYLIEKDIPFSYQKSFDTCLSPAGNKLIYDFYLSNHKVLLEYDGEFHFSKLFADQNFELLQKHDNIKTQWALDNNYQLIRITYKQNLEKELKRIFNEYLHHKVDATVLSAL